ILARVAHNSFRRPLWQRPDKESRHKSGNEYTSLHRANQLPWAYKMDVIPAWPDEPANLQCTAHEPTEGTGRPWFAVDRSDRSRLRHVPKAFLPRDRSRATSPRTLSAKQEKCLPRVQVIQSPVRGNAE